MIKADGKPDKVTAKVTAGKKRVKGVKVGVTGAGVSKTARTNGKGVAVLRINPTQAGDHHGHRRRVQPEALRPEAHRGRGGLPPAAHGLAGRGRYARVEGRLRSPLDL